VTNLREHREFEKEFEVKTALVGERELAHAAEVGKHHFLFLAHYTQNGSAFEGLYELPTIFFFR
jgi:hypothetical protein